MYAVNPSTQETGAGRCLEFEDATQRNSVSKKKKKSDTLIRANVRIYCTIIAFANFKIILSIKIKKSIEVLPHKMYSLIA